MVPCETRNASPMNPNAPEHQPENDSRKSIIKVIAEKIWSEPDPEAAQILNKSI